MSDSRNVQEKIFFFLFSLAAWLYFFSRLKWKNRLAHKKPVLVVLTFISTILPHWIHSKDWYLFCMLLYPLWQHRTWGTCRNKGKTQGVIFTTLTFSFYNLKWICFNLSIYKISVCSKAGGQEGQWHPGLCQQDQGCEYSPLLCTAEATPWVLHSVLGPSP